MGNQPSKDKKGEKSINGGGAAPPLESYPSFSKSDTKDSSRSLRGSIRSKIPGGGRTDSPKTPAQALADGAVATNGAASVHGAPTVNSATTVNSTSDKADDKPPRTAESPVSALQAQVPRLSMSSVSRSSLDGQSGRDGAGDKIEPPPSPVQSATLGKGHKSIDRAQETGEVGAVSDEPPQGHRTYPHSHVPREPILMKKDVHIPRAPEVPPTTDGTGPSVDMGGLKSKDLDEMITRLLDAGYTAKVTKAVCLKNAEIFAICQAARELFLSQPALLELSPPVKIVGDVHGQYGDLIRMFEMSGFPPESNFLFLGDYVDRGKQSLETILLLLCYKLRHPENFFLLRGNHECANVTRVYGFYDECKRRCNVKVWKSFVDTFNSLPIAAIVANKIFCVHGGLSPSLTHMDDIRQIVRPTDVPDYGLLNDLLWSDPAEMDSDWESNERGVSYCFGKKVIMQFLQRYDLDLVCRAHMVVEDGYEFFSDRILVTVFSAPNVSVSPRFPAFPARSGSAK